MSRKTSEGRAIQADIGAGLLKIVFGGKPYTHAMIELVKNCRDWGANLILVSTDLGRHLVRIVDNGVGMGGANRNAFLSINMSTAKGPKQSGLFDTGTKTFLFSHATHVRVRTAPAEEPDLVYQFEFTTEAYEVLALSKGTLHAECVRKTAETWPYDFRTGTEITYTLKDPRSRGILRGAQLADELSARLPLKFRDIVRVDNQMIPAKEIVGKIGDWNEPHPQLGQIIFEVYRPKAKRREEDLRLTAAEVGEVPMSNLFRILPDELRRSFPAVYLLPEVCGTISASYLKDYANEDRVSLQPALADDPRTPHFIRILSMYAPEVMRRLQIRMKTAEVDVDSDKADVQEVVELFNKRYNSGQKAPPSTTTDDIVHCEPEEHGTTGSDTKPAVRLKYSKEFEPGEKIVIAVKLRDDLISAGYSLSDLQVHTDRSRAKDVTLTDDGLTMTAGEVGHGVLRFDLPGTPYSTIAHYDVVPQRIFRLSIPYAEIEAGSVLPIMAVNMDKLKGEVAWRLNGPGEIEVQGGRVLFSATGLGHAVVTAFDTGSPGTVASCDIQVVPGRPNLLCIRDTFFDYSIYDAEGSTEHAKPVTMMMGGRIHRLIINRGAHGYRMAQTRGILPQFLAQATALAFPAFKQIELDGMKLEDFDPRDLPALLRDLTNDGYAIFEEILTGKKKEKE